MKLQRCKDCNAQLRSRDRGAGPHPPPPNGTIMLGPGPSESLRGAVESRRGSAWAGWFRRRRWRGGDGGGGGFGVRAEGPATDGRVDEAGKRGECAARRGLHNCAPRDRAGNAVSFDLKPSHFISEKTSCSRAFRGILGGQRFRPGAIVFRENAFPSAE